jgi:hypothetical protein
MKSRPHACFWSDRCYWIRDPDGTYTLIPMCIGAAQDPSGCTCEQPQSRIERAEERVIIARSEVERLRQKIFAASERLTRSEAANRELRRRLREATE